MPIHITMASDGIWVNDATSDEWYQKGMEYYRNKDYETAISYFDKALALDPNFESALNKKGIALYQMGQFNKSQSIFDKILTINPQNQEALKNWQAVLKVSSSSRDYVNTFSKEKRTTSIFLWVLIVVVIIFVLVIALLFFGI